MNSFNVGDAIINLRDESISGETSISRKLVIINQMGRVPHINKSKYILECMMNIICDNRLSVVDRFRSFSENRTLDRDTLEHCYLFYYNNFPHPTYPHEYKIMSAQYILTNVNRNTRDLREIHGYVSRMIRDTSMPQQIRILCEQMLSHNGYIPIGDHELEVLNAAVAQHQYTATAAYPRLDGLNDTQRTIAVRRRTVYEDGQNVHVTGVNEGVRVIIKKLYLEYKPWVVYPARSGSVSDVNLWISKISAGCKPIIQRQIEGSLNRIMTDTSIFECDTNLVDILILVYKKIFSSGDINELQIRMTEELVEMNGLCATGHLSRLINVLGGFFVGYTVGISYRDQIKTYVFARFNAILQTSQYSSEMDTIIDEMTESTIDKKPHLIAMVERHTDLDGLYLEFTDISRGDFNSHYNYAITNYCGLE